MPAAYIASRTVRLAQFVQALVIIGHLPREFTRDSFLEFGAFCTDYSVNYLNSFLSNCEINSTHSPTYPKFVERVRPGVYRLTA